MKIREYKPIAILAAVALLGAVANIQRVHAAVTIPVTSTADDGSAGTLRAALAAADHGDIIDATGITGTITLLPDFLTSSQLAITKSVTIIGPGPDKLTIDGNKTSRVIRIFPGLTVVIEGVTIANGLASGAPSGSFPPNSGGGIFNDHSELTVNNCIISGNSADSGGGISNFGRESGNATLKITNSTIKNNSATGSAGAVENSGSFSGSAILKISNSSLNNNSAGVAAGAIFNSGQTSGSATLEVIASTISGNSSENQSGAISSFGSANEDGTSAAIIGSTISGNSARNSVGGIFSANANLAIFNSTFASNLAGDADGECIVINGANATLDIGSTILKGGTGGTILNVAATVKSHGFNISSDGGVHAILGGTGDLNANGDQLDTDPMLGPLADNGGPTFTHLPLPGSPAIDGGSSATLLPFGITTDQRGSLRSVDDLNIANAFLGDGTDIGAVEVQAAPPPPPPQPVADVAVTFLGADKVSVKQGEVLTYTIAVRNFGPDTAPNVVVNDLMSSGTGFLNARATKGSLSAPPVNETGALVWTIGDMANGSAEAAELVVSVIVKGKTTVTNLAVVNSDADDPDAENNVASITTAVAAGGNNGNGGGKKK